MVEIADFVPHAPVPAEIIEEYRGRVPDELIEVWEQYGYGTFGEGFLRVIDPKLYEAEVGDCIGKTQGDGIAIPIMVTGFGDLITIARYGVAVVVLVIALLIVHLWLPAGRRSLGQIAPGIIATLVLWLITGAAFGRYLASFAFTYVTMYAGLASAMIALVFLYACASIFIYGGELNSAIAQTRTKRD